MPFPDKGKPALCPREVPSRRTRMDEQPWLVFGTRRMVWARFSNDVRMMLSRQTRWDTSDRLAMSLR